MDAMTGEINDKVSAGRERIEGTMDDLTGDIGDGEVRRMPPTPVVAAGIVAALVGLGLLGWMVYRGRRNRTLGARLARLQDAMPHAMTQVTQLGGKVRARVRR